MSSLYVKYAMRKFVEEIGMKRIFTVSLLRSWMGGQARSEPERNVSPPQKKKALITSHLRSIERVER